MARDYEKIPAWRIYHRAIHDNRETPGHIWITGNVAKNTKIHKTNCKGYKHYRVLAQISMETLSPTMYYYSEIYHGCPKPLKGGRRRLPLEEACWIGAELEATRFFAGLCLETDIHHSSFLFYEYSLVLHAHTTFMAFQICSNEEKIHFCWKRCYSKTINIHVQRLFFRVLTES